MTLLDDIAAAVLPVAAEFTVDGEATWTVARPDATTRVPAALGTITGTVMRNKVDAAAQALPQTSVHTAPWLFMGALGQAITPQPEDTLTAGARAFVVVGQVATDLGMLEIPLREA